MHKQRTKYYPKQLFRVIFHNLYLYRQQTFMISEKRVINNSIYTERKKEYDTKICR